MACDKCCYYACYVGHGVDYSHGFAKKSSRNTDRDPTNKPGCIEGINAAGGSVEIRYELTLNATPVN